MTRLASIIMTVALIASCDSKAGKYSYRITCDDSAYYAYDYDLDHGDVIIYDGKGNPIILQPRAITIEVLD